MRDIKFRAWTGNSWINEGMVYDWQDKNYVEYIGFQDKDVPVMQYTGLKDKNGIDIYEKDVLRTDRDTSGEVVWSGDWAAFCIRGVNPFLLMYWAHESEVIGNSYERPSLVHEQEEEGESP